MDYEAIPTRRAVKYIGSVEGSAEEVASRERSF